MLPLALWFVTIQSSHFQTSGGTTILNLHTFRLHPFPPQTIRTLSGIAHSCHQQFAHFHSLPIPDTNNPHTFMHCPFPPTIRTPTGISHSGRQQSALFQALP
ncbi:unnamed protein product, partial [Larinioides sclopetarius]